MARVNGGNINFNVNMTVQKNGLNEITQPLKQIQNQLNSLSTDKIDKEFQEAAASAKQLESIINSSWNDKLGQLNLDKFNQSVNTSYGSVAKLRQSLSGAGTSGQQAFNNLAHSVLNTNLQLRQSNKLLDSMATSMANTVKWGITSSIFNTITSSIKSAYYYVKDLDTSLNNIRIVTGQSADEMQRFAKVANNAAGDLGRSTLDYTKAALSFYQQGLSDEEVQARTNVTLKAQNITGVGSEMVDYLTSVWNGFKATAEDAEGYVDKLAKVADSSASDMSELAIAMSKVAATANLVGVDVDQLTAQLATVIATTRQAPESVGTAFKTIYSRINDIKTGADDAQISLGNYSGKMAELGFNVLDANGQLRDTGQVLEQIGSRWNTLSKAQQIYLAQTMGGQRQITQISALFENWTTYSDLLNDSLTAQGTLNQKNNIYLESTAAHMRQLSAETERTYDIMFNQDTVNSFADIFKTALKTFNDYLEGIGGGANVFVNFGAAVANIFNKQIGTAINNQIQQFESWKANLNAIEVKTAMIAQIQRSHNANGENITSSKALEKQAEIAKKTLEVRKALTQQQYNQLTKIQSKVGLLQNEIDYINTYKEDLKKVNVDEQSSLEYLKRRLKSEQETLTTYKEGKVALQELYYLSESIKNEQLDRQKNNKQINLAIKESKENVIRLLESANLLSDNQMKNAWREIVDLVKEGQFSQEKVKQILNSQGIQLQTQEEIVKRLKSACQKRQLIQNGTRQEYERERDALEGIAAQQQGNAARQLNISQIIQRTTGLIQAASSIIGGINVALDNTKTTSEKINGVWSATVGALAGVANAMKPGTGFLVQGALGLLKSSLELLGVWDAIEDHFKTAKQRADEIRESISKINENDKTKNAQISKLEQLVDEYNALSRAAGLYGTKLDSLTENERTRYHQIVNEFTQYNDAVIAGYDEQGNAIVRGQDALKDTIQVLKQAKREADKAAFGNNKKDTFINIENRHNRVQQIDDINDQINDLSKQFRNTNSIDFSNLKNNLSAYEAIYFDIIDKVPDDIATIYLDFSEKIRQASEEGNTEVGMVLLQEAQALGKTLNDYYLNENGINLLTYNSNNLDENLFTVADNNLLEQLRLKKEYRQKIIKQANEIVNYSQEDANELITLFRVFDNQLWEDLETQFKQTGFNTNDLISIFSDIITKQTTDLDPEQVYNLLWDQAQILLQTYSQFGDNLGKAQEQSKKDLEEKLKQDNTATEVAQIIKQSINDIWLSNPALKELLNDDTSRQYLIKIIKNIYGLDDLDLTNRAGTWYANFKTDLEAVLSEMPKILNDIVPGVSQDQTPVKDWLKNNFSSDKIRSIINDISKNGLLFNSLEEFQNYVDNFFKDLDKQEETNNIVENFDKLISAISKLQEGKDLSYKDKMTLVSKLGLTAEDVQDADKLIEKLKDSLKNLGDSEQDLVKRAQALPLIYNNFEKIANALTKGQINETEASFLRKEILNSQLEALNITQEQLEKFARSRRLAFDTDEAKAETLEIYKQAEGLKELADATNEASKAAQDAQLDAIKSRGQMYGNAQSALTKLQNSENGIELTTEEGMALSYLQQQNPLLAALAENEETRGRLGKEYTELLKQQLPLLKQITEESKQQQIDWYQQRKKEQQARLQEIKDQLVSDQEYQEAQNVLASPSNVKADKPQTAKVSQFDLNPLTSFGKQESSPALEMDLETAQRISDEWQAQAELRKEAVDIQQEIAQIDGTIVGLQSNATEEELKLNTAASQRLATFRELSQTLASGGELSAEQMSQLDGVLSKLLERYPELTTSADLLKETWLSGTQMYKDALRQIDEALQQMSYEELNENLTNAADELIDTLNQEYILINVDPSDFEDFQKQVKEFLDADKTITIAVHTDAENDFNRIQEELNGIYDAASKIGQNFIVAANDIRELDTVFPGIMQGMQRLDDGSYQLNSNIVQRAISTAKTSAAADAQAVTDQLHNQASLLRQKAKIYTEMGKAAGILAGTVIDHDMSAADAQALISQDLEKLKTTNAKLAVDNQMQNQKTLVDNTDENAGIVANNWASSAQSISDSIYRATSASIQNFAAMAEAGQAAARLQVRTPGTYNPNIGSTYDGSHGTTGDTVDVDDLTSDYLNNPDTTQDQWAQIQKKYNQMAAVNEAAAADIDRMVAEIGANVSRVGEGLDNVTRGQGIKGSSDKNKSSSSGSSPRSSSPKSSSGSSSKSSSDKAETEKEAEKIETLTDEKDRYHDINLQIKAIEKNLSKVLDREKKLYGKDLIKNLNQQLAILEQQIDAYETKIGLAADERNEIQDSLKAQGVLFDSNTGAITNYAAALDNKLKEINSIINYYNHLSASQQENYKDTVEQAKKDYEDFKKQIENYDKLVSETIPELKQEIRKERDKQVEIAISKFKMAIEIELDLSDARKNWNDFKKKVIDQIREDDVLGQTRSTLENLFAYYDKNNRSKGLIPSLTDQVTNLMQQLDQINSSGFGNVYGNNKAQALEDLENYAKELMDSLEDVEDIIKEVEEAFYDMVDAAQDAFDEQIKEYDFLSNLINHDEKMIQLLYGDQAFDKVSKYYQKQIESDKKELDFQREQKDFWYAKMQAEKNHMERLDEESNAYKEAEKRFKELEDHWLDALEDFNDGVEKSIQNLLTQYKNNVEIIFKDLDNILTKGKGLEYVKEEWELINDSADDFLDKINSMYEIQKLQNAFQDALKDNQDNLAAQKSINNLMTQQLKMLKDKDRLTKYDVDRANLLLQIELKRLALQQSRSNKSKLRLRRDSQGNYTYQYTADEEQISKAEQDLADARNSLYNLDKNQYNKNLGDILSIQQDFNDKLKALYEEYPVWTEQAESKRQLIIEQYGLRINGMVEQNENIRLNLYQSTFDEMAALYDADVQNFTNMSRTQQDQLMTNLIPQWNSGIQEMTNTIAGQGGFIPTCKEAFEELKTNTQDYKESLQDLQSSAGVNFGNISDGIDWDIVKTQELIDDNRQLINTYNQEWDALQRIIDQVRTLTQVYTTAKNEAIAAAQAANDYIEWERQSAAESATADASSGNDNYVDYDELDDLIDLWYPQIDDVSGSSGSSSSGSSSSSSSGTAKKSSSSSDKKKKSNNSGATWQRIVQVYNLINSGQVNNDPYRHNNLANLGYNNTEIAKGQELINKVYPPSLGGAGMTWDAARKAMGYKTGGYTGEWGQEGKIGILHEKELILNAEDTKNILSAVESARDITKLLRLIDTNVTLSNTLSGLTRQNISDVNQQVHITATFPSVNSRVEIEEAFSNLINRASQYSFNTRK